MPFPIETTNKYKDLLDKLSLKLHNLTGLDQAELQNGLKNVLIAYSGKDSLIPGTGAYHAIAQDFADNFIVALEKGKLIDILNEKNNEKRTFKADIDKSSNKAIKAFSILPTIINKFANLKYVDSSNVVSDVIEHKSLLFQALLDPAVNITNAEINTAIANTDFDGISAKLPSPSDYDDLKNALVGAKSFNTDFLTKANDIFTNDKTNFIKNFEELSLSFKDIYEKLDDENQTKFIADLLTKNSFKTANFTDLLDQHKYQVINHYIGSNNQTELTKLYKNPDVKNTIKQDIIIDSITKDVSKKADILAHYFDSDPEAKKIITNIINDVATNSSNKTFSENMKMIRDKLANVKTTNPFIFGLVEVIKDQVFVKPAEEISPDKKAELSFSFLKGFLEKSSPPELIKSLQKIQDGSKKPDPLTAPLTAEEEAKKAAEEDRHERAKNNAKELFKRVNELADNKSKTKDIGINTFSILTLVVVGIGFGIAALTAGTNIALLVAIPVLLGFIAYRSATAKDSHDKHNHKEQILEQEITALANEKSFDKKKENLETLQCLKDEINKTITKDESTSKSISSTVTGTPVKAAVTSSLVALAIGIAAVFSSALTPVGVGILVTTAAVALISGINLMHSNYEKDQYMSNKSEKLAQTISKLDKTIDIQSKKEWASKVRETGKKPEGEGVSFT